MRNLKKHWWFSYLSVFMVLSFAMLNGCASIVAGGPQVIPITSNPPDAQLKIVNLRTGNTMFAGKTPYTATLDRGAGYFKKSRYNIVVEKEGYQAKEMLIEGTASGWYVLGNFVFGGLIGWLIVDPITGSMWTLNPSDINMSLEEKNAFFKDGEGLMIVLKNQLPDLPEGVSSKMKLIN